MTSVLSYPTAVDVMWRFRKLAKSSKRDSSPNDIE
jgi:hypothetical protein